MSRGALARSTAFVSATAAAVHAGPVVSSFGPLRNRVMPRLAGQGRAGHVALTFDDGPDPLSTPHFLDLLDARGLRATFFLLGTMLDRAPALAADMAAAGHELGVHGSLHRPLLLRGPRATYDDIARARDAVADAAGCPPVFFRPPYGVMSAAAHVACRRLGLTPVLWTCWGEDWRKSATPGSVYDTLVRDLRDGGTMLLHDSDCTSAPGSWRTTLAALPGILDTCEERGWDVGPLREHGIPGVAAGPGALYAVPAGADLA